jgi:hypothetical protein
VSDESTKTEAQPGSTNVDVDVTNPASAPPPSQPETAGNPQPSHDSEPRPSEGQNTGTADKDAG